MKRKVCVALLVMSMLVCSAIPAGAVELQNQAGAPKGASATSVIDVAPPVPNVTKFWMSGWNAHWFRMETNLQIGTCVYSIDPDPCTSDGRDKEYKENNPEKFKIKEIPDKFLGCDYIITRKSESKGIHFRAEQKIDVYVAIDADNGEVPASHNRFTKTDDKVKLNNGNTYFLAKRTYEAGSTVEVAAVDSKKYKGDNVFYLILPAEGETVSNALTKNPVVAEGEKPAKNVADEKYQYYLNDVFNQYTAAGVPAGYTGKDARPSGEPTTTEEKSYESGDNLALEKPYTYNSRGFDGSPVDGKASTYWESEGLPGKLTINLEAPSKINRMTLKLRENWGDRSQKLQIETSNDGSEFETLVEAKDYKFNKSDKNIVNIDFAETTAQYVRISGTANSEQNDIQIGEVEIYGPEQEVTLVHVDENRNRHGIISDGGELTRTFEKAITGKIIYEGKVKASSDDKEMSIPVMKSEDGKTAVDLKFSQDGTIKAGNTKVADYEKDTWYTIKMLIDVDAGSYEVWVDHIRKVQNVKFSEDAKNIKTMTFSGTAGELNVDNLRLYDNPEVFIVDSNFNGEASGAIPSGWTYTNAEQVSVEEVPFPEDKSMLLEGKGTAALVAFDPITGDATIEAKVKPMENSWVSVPVIKDSKGNVAVKIAAYRNSFFACNGNNWEYICNQEVPNNYYPAANWYQVKVVLNTYTNRYDLYIDGAKRSGDLSFATDVEDIASVSYTLEEENKLYVDNVKVFDSASLARGLYPKENVFNVRDYGAKGDGKTDDTEAIEKAIQAAQYTGGTVLLENGVFYCGQINMLNDMTLFIDASAEILAKMDRNEYTQFVPSMGYNATHQLGRGIIRSVNADNFRITGGGVLNGNGLYAWSENDPEIKRPCGMYLALSKDVYVDNINIVSSPFWTLVPFESTNLTMRNIAITNNIAPNRDGIDPTGCANFTIENCYIIAGDDALCPKNGNTIESVNCDVRNVFMQSYCNGIKFGTDTYGAFKNYNIEDIWMKCVGLSGITIQSADGSEIDNIRFKRIDMNDVDNCFAFMVGNRKRTYSGGGDYKKHGYIKNVVVEDMNFTNPMLGPYNHQGEGIREALLIGLNPKDKETIQDGKEATHRISNVLFKNVYMEMPGGVKEVPKQPQGILDNYPEHGAMCKGEGEGPVGWAYNMRWADNVSFENCTNVLLKKDVRKEYSYDEYTSDKIEPCTVSSEVKQIPYGIVFETDGKTLEAPVISGKIGAGSEVTVLTDSQLKVFEEKYDLKLERDIFKNAIIKCTSDGSLQLLDSTSTIVLAEAKNEKFLNEDGTRQVFHVTNKEVELPEVCYVTFEADGQQQVVRVPKGKTVEAVTEPAKQGFEFAGWYLDGKAFDFKTTIDEDITLTARFEEDTKPPTGDNSSKDDPTGDNPSEDDPTGDNPPEEDPPGDNPSKDDQTGDNPSKDAPIGDNPSKDDSAGDNPSKDDPTGDNPSKDDPSGDNLSKDDPTGDNPSKDEPSKEEPSTENPPAENPPIEEPTTKNPPIENPPAENPPGEKPSEDVNLTKQIEQIAAEYKVSQDTLDVTESYVTGFAGEKDVKGSVFGILQARAKKQTKTSVKLSWKAIDGADGYLVYGNRCGKNNSYKLLTTLAGKNATAYTEKGLKKGTYYKYLVCAYRNVGDTKVTLAASKTIHAVTKGGKYGEAKIAGVKPANVSIRVGKSQKLSVKEVKAGIKMKTYRKLSYESDNTEVATVSKSGRIKGKKTGSCYVYVYAQNGAFRKVRVTVK